MRLEGLSVQVVSEYGLVAFYENCQPTLHDLHHGSVVALLDGGTLVREGWETANEETALVPPRWFW